MLDISGLNYECIMGGQWSSARPLAIHITALILNVGRITYNLLFRLVRSEILKVIYFEIVYSEYEMSKKYIRAIRDSINIFNI